MWLYIIEETRLKESFAQIEQMILNKRWNTLSVSSFL